LRGNSLLPGQQKSRALRGRKDNVVRRVVLRAQQSVHLLRGLVQAVEYPGVEMTPHPIPGTRNVVGRAHLRGKGANAGFNVVPDTHAGTTIPRQRTPTSRAYIAQQQVLPLAAAVQRHHRGAALASPSKPRCHCGLPIQRAPQATEQAWHLLLCQKCSYGERTG
jgi:hypothetical protein